MDANNMNIRDLISQAGKQLRAEFEEIRSSVPHFGESGAEAEEILRRFLDSHLPKRYKATTGLAIDTQNRISKQTDVIIYDALNSPVYRQGPRVAIIPSDNVAAVIEVKSMLNKAELGDGAEKIASVKSLSKSPLSNVDQPVTMSTFIATQTLGVVFAHDSQTSLETLSENLLELNASYPTNQWIDLVVVLDKGIITYALQKLFEDKLAGWFSKATVHDFMIPPHFIHLVKEENAELALNKFFFHLVNHLAFFRKRSTVTFESLMGKLQSECMTISAYQYNLKRELVDVEEFHQPGKFNGPKLRYNLFTKDKREFRGQIGWVPWQDGAVITYSGLINPTIVFHQYFEKAKQKIYFVRGMENTDFWTTPVIALSQEDFIQITEGLQIDLQVEKDTSQDDDFTWLKNSLNIK